MCFGLNGVCITDWVERLRSHEGKTLGEALPEYVRYDFGRFVVDLPGYATDQQSLDGRANSSYLNGHETLGPMMKWAGWAYTFDADVVLDAELLDLLEDENLFDPHPDFLVFDEDIMGRLEREDWEHYLTNYAWSDHLERIVQDLLAEEFLPDDLDAPTLDAALAEATGHGFAWEHDGTSAYIVDGYPYTMRGGVKAALKELQLL